MGSELEYDPLKEERKWWERGEDVSRESNPLPAKHEFAHNHVRSRLYDILTALGGSATSLVLEVGCGSGEDAVHVRRITKRIVGVDISAIAIKGFADKGFVGVLADVKALPFRDDSFDFVISSGLLHHLVGQGNLTTYLNEFARVTRRGGYVIALEPNLFNHSGLLMNIFNTIKPGITGLVPHERALSPLRLTRAFDMAKLINVKCISASYVWNRFPLPVSKFIAKYEDKVRFRKPFNLFGWFIIVAGQKIAAKEENEK